MHSGVALEMLPQGGDVVEQADYPMQGIGTFLRCGSGVGSLAEELKPQGTIPREVPLL